MTRIPYHNFERRVLPQVKDSILHSNRNRSELPVPRTERYLENFRYELWFERVHVSQSTTDHLWWSYN